MRCMESMDALWRATLPAPLVCAATRISSISSGESLTLTAPRFSSKRYKDISSASQPIDTVSDTTYLDFAGTGNWNDLVALSEDPSKRHLCWCGVVSLANFRQRVDQSDDTREVLFRVPKTVIS